MKKILSLLLLALIGVNIASAQMTATCKGKEVQDGDEIVFYAHEQIDDFTGASAITCGPHTIEAGDIVFRSSELSKKVTITLNAVFPAEAVNNSTFSWCAGGNCAPITSTYTSRDIKGINGLGQFGEMNEVATLKLHTFELTKGKYVDYPVEITVRSGMTTIMTFTVRFVYSEETLNKEMSHITTGIGSTTVQAQSVKFNGQALAYHFNGQAVRQLNVYGTDGKLVKTAALTATDGQLSLAGLPKGVYVFHLTEGNATLQSGKVVLK